MRIKTKALSTIALMLVLWILLLRLYDTNVEFTILPIEDDYTKMNGGVPVEGYYYAVGFKENKQGMATLFNYLNHKAHIPYEKTITILSDKNDVVFEDGTDRIKYSAKSYFFIELTHGGYYKDIVSSAEYNTNEYEFIEENKQPYEITRYESQSIIEMDYHRLSNPILQHFLNVIEYERHIKDNPLGIYSYRLKNKNTQLIECEIIYYNEPDKGLDNVFTIHFM